MSAFNLTQLEDQFNHQVIHMDQAVCYSPEYRASGMMHDYPSRKLQLARAVWKDELEPSEYISQLIFNHIFSRQGERWQNFGEDPEDCTHIFMLCREQMMKLGYGKTIAEEIEADFIKYNGHFLPVSETEAIWLAAIPVDADSDTLILLDDATAYYAKDSAAVLGNYLKQKSMASKAAVLPVCDGFEFFAHGLIDRGTAQLQTLADCINESGAKKVLVLSARTAWILRKFAPFLKIDIHAAIEYLPEIMVPVIVEAAYVYGGSFNLRYLCNSDRLNALFPNRTEERIKTSAEFIPLLQADHRVNKLTIWQRPLCPEYQCYGMPAETLKAIKEDAVNDMKKADFKNLLVFEPTALPILKTCFADHQVNYYLDLLD